MQIELSALLNLHLVDGIGSNRLRALVNKFDGRLEAIFQADLKELNTIEGIDLKLAQRIRQAANQNYAESQIELAQKHNTRIITFWDKEYPENLKRIYDPPVLLFVRGELNPTDHLAIAVVGTRVPTNYGKFSAETFSRQLAREGIVIVSGLARGIDTIAHVSALKAGGRTIAVLGCGVDVIYPAENKKLFYEIIEHGAVISEFLMGTKPDATNFPRRNRIVSGLSLGVLVIEAGAKSGALITANMALEQNREIFALPGNINSPKSFGCNKLIMEGAKLAMQTDDILDELRPQLNHLLKKEKIRTKQVSLTPVEQSLLESLSHEALHIDRIASENNLSISQALGTLLTLELKELVRQLPGKYFIRV